MSIYNYEIESLIDNVKEEHTYLSETKKEVIDGVKGNYPQLCTYESEWIYFDESGYIPGKPVEIEYQMVEGTNCIVENAIPHNYKSAILKGNTGYRDIDTGEFLETFEEGRNLELVSVKMPVLKTTGKNLFNPNWQLNTWYPFKVKSGTNLTLSTKDSVPSNGGNIRLKATDETDIWVGINEGATKRTITLQKDVYKLSNMLNGNIEYQLEIGDKTLYEPFKSNILTVNEEVHLRRINDVQDELNLLTGELTQRVEEIVLDGSENWDKQMNNTKLPYRFICANLLNYSNYKEICDSFKTGQSCWNVDTTGLYIGTNHKLVIAFKSDDDRNNYTVAEFKQYLSENPITVQYYLTTESVKTVDLTPISCPFDGYNKFTTSSDTIPPIMNLQVPVVSTGKQTLQEINE